MADFGCHRIEVLLDLLGPVEEVSGFPGNVHFRDREVEDTCVAHLLFRGGARAVLTVTHAARESRDTVELYGSKHNPTLGRNVETMDPLEWLARMADHIPDPGRHRTLFYA